MREIMLYRIIMMGQAGMTLLLAGLVLAVQTTAFSGRFCLLSVLPVSGIVIGGFWWIWRRCGGIPPDAGRIDAGETLSRICFGVGGLVILVRVVYPLLIWPHSSAGAVVPYDALAYHFPQAVELWKTGTLWNTGVTRWEYPSGYEGLLALSYLITHREVLFGFAHALILLHFAFTLCALMVRHTRLPVGMLVLIVAVGLIYPPLGWTVFEVGKNDLFLAGAVLSVLLYATNGSGWPCLPGLALSSALALAIKPTAIPVVAMAWGWMMMRHVLRGGSVKREAVRWAAWGLWMVPGLLWVIRNMAIQGMLFSGEVMGQSGWTIARNLFNREFYRVLKGWDLGLLQAVGGVTFLLAFLLWWRRPARREAAAMLVVLFGLFIVTPCSALWNNNIQWRFAAPLFAFLWVAGTASAEPLLERIWLGMAGCRALLVASVAICIVCGLFLYRAREHLRMYPGNGRMLKDWFACSVGTGGYYSAYDYVGKELRRRVVASNHGLPYLLYGSHFENIPVMGADRHRARRNGVPEVYVAFGCDKAGAVVMHPESDTGVTVAGVEQSPEWVLRYADPQAKVYVRRE